MTTITCNRCFRKQDYDRPYFKPTGMFTESMRRELDMVNDYDDMHFCMDCLKILIDRIKDWHRRAER